MNTCDDVATAFDSQQADENSKSEDSDHANDSPKKASPRADGNQKSMLIMMHNEIAICPDKESLFENEQWNRDAANSR
jgi:hypothetical protein